MVSFVLCGEIVVLFCHLMANLKVVEQVCDGNVRLPCPKKPRAPKGCPKEWLVLQHAFKEVYIYIDSVLNTVFYLPLF